MKKYFPIFLAIVFCCTAASSGFASLTVIKDYKVTVTIPESVEMSDSQTADQKAPQEFKKQEEPMTIMERLWRDSQVLLVKTVVVK